MGANGVPTRMGDIASYINGAAFKPSDWSNAGKPIIRIQNLNDASAPYNYFSGELDKKYEVHTGDVLISWATHLEAYIWSGDDSWLNQHIFRVDFNKGDIKKALRSVIWNKYKIHDNDVFNKAYNYIEEYY